MYYITVSKLNKLNQLETLKFLGLKYENNCKKQQTYKKKYKLENFLKNEFLIEKYIIKQNSWKKKNNKKRKERIRLLVIELIDGALYILCILAEFKFTCSW